MINEKRSEFQILKNRIENYKKRKNGKNLFMKPNQEKNLALLKRPYSNYIRNNNNNILEKGNINNNLCYSQIRKPNKVVINKLINCSDIDDNSLSFVKIKHQKKYFKNNVFIESNRRESNKEYNIPKSAKAELKIRKSFLFDNKLFNNVNTNISKRTIRGSLSNRNNYHKNKYLEITRELFSEKKRNKVYMTPNSPSTTNNSNINDNSYSSHFLFGISSLNSYIYPKALQNNFIIENLFNNKESNNKINLENNKIKTSIENNINKFLSKNESFTKNKNLFKNIQNFNLDDFYFHYSKFNNEEEPIINIPIKSKYRNKVKNEEIICNNTINLIKSKNIINRNNNINKIKKNKNKISNLIIKYTFLNNEFQKIKRKVDFINPKNGEQIKLDTTNVDNNNKINFKKEDFKTYGYEMTPEELYKIYQKNNQKRMIKIRKEKKENKNYKENEDNKKIKPKYFILNRNNNMKNKIEKSQKYRKINTNNKNANKMNNKNEMEENNNKKEMGNDTNDLLNIYSFGLGESLYKNKLDYNLINEEDKEDGKKLWSKLNKYKNKSSINIHSKIKPKTEKRISYKNINMNKKRIKSAKVYKTIHINKSIKKEKPILINNEIEKEKNILNNHKFVRKMMKKNFTQKIDTLEQHKLFRNEKGFEEIKNTNDNIYNIDFRITDEDEEDEYTIDKIVEKENEELEEKDLVESYILNNNKNISKRRNTTADIGKFANKLYKVKKNSKKDFNRVNKNKINSNIKKIKDKNKETKIKDKNKETKIIDKNKETKIIDKNKETKIIDKSQRPNSKINNSNNIKRFRIKNNKKIFEKEKYKNKFKEKEVKIINKEKDENYFNFVKNKSVDIGDNKILDELYTTLENLENEVYNLSTENAIYTNHINMEDIIKRQNQRKSNLIFDRIFKNYKYKYIEDENMEKYFDQIFNKYAREENDEKFVDVKFFGYEFKIKQKNQNNFKNILMRNIRQQEKELKENQIMQSKLNLILNKFTKNKKSIRNKEIYNSSILFRKNRNYLKKNITKEISNNKAIKLNNEETEEDKDYKNKYFIGIKMDSLKELEEKKEEILEKMKDDIRCRILKGEIGHSEMDNFLNFQKRMNSYRIDLTYSKHFIKLLEQEFTSFEEELKIKEQKKKEEKRINHFFNNMNYDIEKNNYIKKAQKKLFGDFFDFNEKFNINILSPTKEIYIK